MDFYNASSLLGLSDEQAVECALRKYLQGSLPAFSSAVVQDFNVTRYFTCLISQDSHVSFVHIWKVSKTLVFHVRPVSIEDLFGM